jgi:hypothetical protein
VVPSHAVFNTPLKVNLEFEEVPTPVNYLASLWGGGKQLGKTIKVWRVQTKKFPEIDPGLVSNPYGFEDSPDAEVISSGLNSKGPESVALARHANFFLWGFSAPPRDMTAEARKCFVNAVCYIKRFDGERPIARKAGAGWTRHGAVMHADYLRFIANEDAYKRELPADLRDDSKWYARHRQSVLKNAYENYPADVRRRFGTDPEKYIGWVKENLEYLRFDGEGYDAKTLVDEDVKGLGLSNRKVELLDRCVAMLEQGDRTELASRILKRYTTEDFPEVRGWRSWLETNRSRLFFTEAGGFKWLVAPESLLMARFTDVSSTSDAGKNPKPNQEHPVVASAELSPSRVRPGDTAVLVVRVQTAPTWHIYAVSGSRGPGVPTSFKLKLPDGVEAEGDWDVATPTRSSDGQIIYEGEVEFRRKLRLGAGVAIGALRVACELGYQACDPQSCRPPTRAELVAKAEVAVDAPKR